MIKRLIEKRINSIVEKMLFQRKDEITLRISSELGLYETEQKLILSEKQTQLDKLTQEKDRLIRKVEEEKSKLSETLNIINQNLTAQDIWLKLWTIAFDKAMDICWDLSKDNTKKIVDLVKEKAMQDMKLNTQAIIDAHNKNLEEQLTNMELNKMSVINARNDAHKSYLIYNKNKDKEKEAYYKGQLDVTERILNEKMDKRS